MDRDLLIDYIENGIEESWIDFKRDIYDFSSKESKAEFLKDVLSFANGHFNGDKYIITGVKLKKNGPRTFHSINEDNIQDGADYQSLIDENIEPSVTVDFDVIEYNAQKFGVFRIKKNNNDKPYLLKKKYGNLDQGYIRIRKGQHNGFATRRDLDLFYENKLKKESSDIIVRGINNNKINDKFSVYKLIDNITLNKVEEKLAALKIKISDEIAHINKINFEKSDKGNFPTFGKPVHIDKDNTGIIEKYANENNIQLNSDFFDLGKLSQQSFSFSSGIYYGSDEEQEKRKLIYELADSINVYYGISEFYSNVKQIYYTELVIENIGSKFDDDVAVTLIIGKDNFLDYKNFPLPTKSLIEEFVEDDVLDKYLVISQVVGINSYSGNANKIKPSKPSYTFASLQHVAPSYEEYQAYCYEYIECLADYEILSDENNYYITFEQSKIKPNEKIFIPAKLLFKGIPDSIGYEIKTKHNSKIMKGSIYLNSGSAANSDKK